MSLDSISVSTIMSRSVKTVAEGRDMRAVCRVMRDNNIGSVVIVKMQEEEPIPIGIITERDIVRTLGRETVDLNEQLADFMSKPIITIQSNSSAREAIHLMNSKNIRRIIVVDSSGKMVGILTQKDIFKEISRNPNLITSFIGEKYPAEYREVYTRFTDYMLDFVPKL
jgi:predicted transcriptional regulator